jgi:hypothetical protein
MKKILIAFLVVLSVVSAYAQPRRRATACVVGCSGARTIALSTYADASTAGSDLSLLATGDFQFTGNAVQPWIAFRVVYCGSCYFPPPIVPVSWHEFKSPTIDDSWCAANYQHPFLASPSTCAAYWYDRIWNTSAPSSIGLTTTHENTVILWWF